MSKGKVICGLVLVVLGAAWALGGRGVGATVRAAQTFHVSPDGDDAAPGTEAQPFRTLGFALAALGPGDTLVLRGGRYFERDLALNVVSDASAPLTVRAFPGELPVIDGSYPEFRGPDRRLLWEPALGRRDVYRSTALYPDAGLAFGYLPESEGSFRLVPYESLRTLASPVETYTDIEPFYYAGPGLAWSAVDQRIYARLHPGNQQAKLDLAVPANRDPRLNELVVFPDRPLLRLGSSARNIVFDGVQFEYGGHGLELLSGASGITLRRCGFVSGRYSVIARNGVSDLAFDQCRFVGHFPPYVPRSDVKEPEIGRPARQMQGAAILLLDRTEDVVVRRSSFRGLFDAIDATDAPVGLEVSYCVFEDVRDDVLQLGTAGHDVEFAYNLLRRVNVGPSWHGSGSAPAGSIGTKYFHHNVIDAARPQLYGREDPQGLLPSAWRGPAGDGFAVGRPIGLHESALATAPDPWKIYNNTFYLGADVDGGGAGQAYRLPFSDPANPHEVYNNVFVQVSDHHVLRRAHVADGSQRHDGNLYHRTVATPSRPLFALLENDFTSEDFDTLSGFLSSSLWGMTQAFYPPGWDASGVEGDPLLSAEHVPDPSGPAASGGVDLSATGWPGTSASTYRGARKP